MTDARKERLAAFVDWARQHVTGDEKGQAQIFLDRLFQAFGQRGSLDVGGAPEFRIRKAQEDGGGTAFADYVWKPVVLIEMKRRGVDLAHHFRQAFDYWVRLVPDRPQYAVLSNFDEFWIYDFNVQMDSPVDTVKLDELPDGKPSRWAIDFGRLDALEASSYELPFKRVKDLVMPTVLEKANEERQKKGKESTRWTRMAERWWQFRDQQPGTMRAIARIPRYVACSRVTKRPLFAFVS